MGAMSADRSGTHFPANFQDPFKLTLPFTAKKFTFERVGALASTEKQRHQTFKWNIQQHFRSQKSSPVGSVIFRNDNKRYERKLGKTQH